MAAPVDAARARMHRDAAAGVMHMKLALLGAGIGLGHMIDHRLRRHSLAEEPHAPIAPERVRQCLGRERADAAFAMWADRPDGEELARNRDAISAGWIARDDRPGHADVLRTMAGVSSLSEGAPTCCMATRNSARRIVSTRSTPAWPNAPSPHRYGRPMHTARAPSANALAMSLPRRKPLSIRIGIRPPTASAISGSTSMVALTPSSTRPPWFDTMIASMPASAARFASSVSRMPLSTNLPFTMSRSRLIESQVRLVTIVPVTPVRSVAAHVALGA